MTLADEASERKYGMSAGQSVKLHSDVTVVWVASSDFKFVKSDLFSLRNMYKAEPYQGGARKYVEGIWAGKEFNTEDLARAFPEVFTSYPGEPLVFYLRLSCDVGGKAGRFNMKKRGEVGILNEGLGLVEYPYPNGVVSVPADAKVKNPDGSPVLVECTMGARCEASFHLTPEVLVRYDYPLSQRQNWLKIQKFLVENLSGAKGFTYEAGTK